MKHYMKNRRDLRRSKAKAYLGSQCIQCESTENLEFDHIDPTTKAFNISSAKALDSSWDNFLKELSKCQLLCQEHHLEKTIKENQSKTIWNKTLKPKHGTAVMYGRLKCRCITCKQWKKAYRNKTVDSLGNFRSEEPIQVLGPAC